MNDLDRALRILGGERTLLQQLVTELHPARLVFETSSLPPRNDPPAPQGPWAESRPPTPTLAPQEVARIWQTEGETWLMSLGRRDLSAVAAALIAPSTRDKLATDETLVRTVVGRLRPRRRAALLSRLYFVEYPPRRFVVSQIAASRHALHEHHVPKWWAMQPDSVPEFVSALVRQVARYGWPVAQSHLELPDEAAGPTWVSALLRKGRVRDLAIAERLLRYADRGVEMRAPAPVHAGLRAAARMLVRSAEGVPALRMDVARLLRRRIADVFGVVDQARWEGLDDEQRRIRQWVAAEILEILFRRLVPRGIQGQQTGPRRVFWKQYTARVDRVWLLIHDRLAPRLNHPDLAALMEKVGDVIEVRPLRGGSEQAVLWMFLAGDTHGTVTVVEGNANTSCRIRRGRHAPPAGRPGKNAVDYTSDIVRGTFADRLTEVSTVPHTGDWQARVRKHLAAEGVFESH